MAIVKIFFASLASLCLTSYFAPAQFFHCFSDSTNNNKWIAGITLEQSFHVDGYLQVREDQYEGDKLSLTDDLGVTSMHSAGIVIERKLTRSSSLSFSFQDIFFSTHPVITKDIWYNGTHLKGADGISLGGSTAWYHMQLVYEKHFAMNRSLQLSVAPGLIYDGITLYVNGTVLPYTYHHDQGEDFITQSLPFPNLEINILYPLTAQVETKGFSNFTSALSFEVNATVIPLFKSFYQEGGQVSLKYSCLNAALSYNYLHKHLAFKSGFTYHQVRTFEESAEDTNDFSIRFSGIDLSCGYLF